MEREENSKIFTAYSNFEFETRQVKCFFYTLPKVALYVLFFIMIMKGMKKSTIQLIESKSLNIIFQLKGLKPKNKGHTNFYECCDLTKKVYLMTHISYLK